jgi:hypothetical protein
MKKYIYILATAMLLTVSVASLSRADEPVLPTQEGVVPWGGPGIELYPSGQSAQIYFGCGSANIPKGWKINRKHKTLELKGTYTQSYGNPPVGWTPTPVPARFTIKVKNDKMVLKMRLQGGDGVQTFNLVRNYQGILYHCM